MARPPSHVRRRLSALWRGRATRSSSSGAWEEEREGEAAAVWGSGARGRPDLAVLNLGPQRNSGSGSLPEVPEVVAADLGVTPALGGEADARVIAIRMLRTSSPCRCLVASSE